MSKLWDIATAGDWLTPLYALIRNHLRDGITVVVPAEWLQVADPADVLRRNGVQVWAVQWRGDDYLFSIPRRQDRLAKLILKREMGLLLEDVRPNRLGELLWWLMLAALVGALTLALSSIFDLPHWAWPH